MEKFIEELDKLFEKYQVEDADRARIGGLLAGDLRYIACCGLACLPGRLP